MIERKLKINWMTISRLESHTHIFDDTLCIWEEFLDEQLMALDTTKVPWYVDIVDFLASGMYPTNATSQRKKVVS